MEDKERIAVLETEVDTLRADLDGPLGVRVVQKSIIETLSTVQQKLSNVELKVGAWMALFVVLGNKLLAYGLDSLFK